MIRFNIPKGKNETVMRDDTRSSNDMADGQHEEAEYELARIVEQFKRLAGKTKEQVEK